MDTLSVKLIAEILSHTTHNDVASARQISSKFYTATLSPILAEKEKYVYNTNCDHYSFPTFIKTFMTSNRKIYHLSICHTKIKEQLKPLLDKQAEFIESLYLKHCSINPKHFWKYITACVNLKTLTFEQCDDHQIMNYVLEHPNSLICLNSVRKISIAPCPSLPNLMSDVVKKVFPNVTDLTLNMVEDSYYRQENLTMIDMNADILKYITEQSDTLQRIRIYAYRSVHPLLLMDIADVSFANLKELNLTLYQWSGTTDLMEYFVSKQPKLEVLKFQTIHDAFNSVSDKLFRDIARYLTGLKELYIKGKCVTSFDVLAGVLIETPIRRFSYHVTVGFVESFKMIPEVRLNENLLELTIGVPSLYSECVKWMTQSFPKLVVLNILYCEMAVNDDVLQLILRNLKNLKTLKLRKCTEVSYKAFGKVYGGSGGSGTSLSFCECLKDLEHLCLTKCPGVNNFTLKNYFKLPSLISLSLFGCENVSDNGFMSLVDNHPYLESLNVGKTNISSNTIMYLARSMKHLRILMLYKRHRDLSLKSLAEASKSLKIVIFKGVEYRRRPNKAIFYRIKLDIPEGEFKWFQDAIMSI